MAVLARAAVEHVQAEVRELIRRRGIDPVADPRGARDLIDRVIDHYEERVTTSSLPAKRHRGHVMREVFDAVAGFGPLQRFLDDPDVEEIWVNQPGQVFIARNGRSELTTAPAGDRDRRLGRDPCPDHPIGNAIRAARVSQ